MTNAGWPKEWIDGAIAKLVKEWKAHYQPKTASKEAQPQSNQFAYLTYLQHMHPTTGNSNHSSTCLVHNFVYGTPVLEPPRDGQPILFNPLVWWCRQQTVANEWDGLTQLAIDVLLCPATSVDIECAFSLPSTIVTKHWHNLSAQTIQANATLASYSKAGLVKQGALTKILHAEKAKKKANKAKSKAKGKAKA